MCPSKPDSSHGNRRNALAEARQVLKDLREVGRWQTGLVCRLEQVLSELDEPKGGKRLTRE